MELSINSVWQSVDTQEKFRVIYLLINSSEVVIYSLHEDRKRISKPIISDVADIKEKIQKGMLVSSDFPLPGIMLYDEESYSQELIAARDSRYNTIKDLISNERFIVEHANHSRSKLAAAFARKNHLSIQTLYRTLKDFWRYGMSKNALIPLRSNQGGLGKEKKYSSAKRGRPVTPSTFKLAISEGYNVSTEDKNRIKKGFIQFYGNGYERTLKEAYEDTLNEYYKQEIIASKTTGIPLHVPTFRQFSYWARLRTDTIKISNCRNPIGDFERNRRALTNSTQSSAVVPGRVFEIDATLADVHIVSPLNRNINIGRPVIYSITDRASRMIVGFYVCLKNPSWETARLAILHAFSPKVEYCKRYKIDITTEDWPCHHLPETLMSDRGEMQGKVPSAIIPTLGISFELAPSSRPDMKSIVESRFGIINKETLHCVPGTTKGKPTQRGEIAPEKTAILTLDEITNLLLRDVMKHNNTHTFDELATVDLITANLPATPLNFWKYHLSRHRHCLRVMPVSELKALVLPTVEAKVTRHGIKYGDIYYTCELAESENWFARARSTGEWKLEAKFDENWVAELYIKPHKTSGFILCNTTDRSRRYNTLHHSDVVYMADFKRSKNPNIDRHFASMENFEHRNTLVRSAQEEKKADTAEYTHLKKSKKTSSFRENRKNEIVRMSQEKAQVPVDNSEESLSATVTPKHIEGSSPNKKDFAIFKRLWEKQDGD
ncbi:MAG: hypothetical protein U1F46_08750 [Marinagarivorans sp.]